MMLYAAAYLAPFTRDFYAAAPRALRARDVVYAYVPYAFADVFMSCRLMPL